MANDLQSLHLDGSSISNGGPNMLLVIKPVSRYVDGKPSDSFDYKCTVVAPKNGYNRFEITVSEKPAFEVTDGEPVPVEFNNLVVKIYRKFNDSVGYGLSCKAQSVVLSTKKAQ